MSVDWITVVAQIGNFLVLVWLLKRFLYRPVVQAMDRREAHIAQRLSSAERQREAAAQEALTYQEQQAAFDAERARLLGEAREAAEAERQALETAAREETEAKKRAWLGELEDERAAFLQDVRERCTEQFWQLARQGLRALANVELERQLVTVFIERLEALDPAEKSRLGGLDGRPRRGVDEGGAGLEIQSRFRLTPELEQTLSAAVRECVGEEMTVRFSASEDHACGIRLQGPHHGIAWTLDDYLDGLEELTAPLMAERVGEGTNTEREAER